MVISLVATMMLGGLTTSAFATNSLEEMESIVNKVNFKEVSFGELMKSLVGDDISKLDLDQIEALKREFEDILEYEDSEDEEDIRENIEEKKWFVEYLDLEIRGVFKVRNRVDELKRSLKNAKEDDVRAIEKKDYERAQKIISEIEDIFGGKESIEVKTKEENDRIEEMEEKAENMISYITDGRKPWIEYDGEIEELIRINPILKNGEDYKRFKKLHSRLNELADLERELTDEEAEEFEVCDEKCVKVMRTIERNTRYNLYLEQVKDELEQIEKHREGIAQSEDYKSVLNYCDEMETYCDKEKNGKIDAEDIDRFYEIHGVVDNLIIKLKSIK